MKLQLLTKDKPYYWNREQMITRSYKSKLMISRKSWTREIRYIHKIGILLPKIAPNNHKLKDWERIWKKRTTSLKTCKMKSIKWDWIKINLDQQVKVLDLQVGSKHHLVFLENHLWMRSKCLESNLKNLLLL